MSIDIENNKKGSNNENDILLENKILNENFISKNNIEIYIKCLLLFLIFYSLIPPIFVTFYYGFKNIDKLNSFTIYLYNICIGIILSFFILISIVSIIVTNNVKKCMIFLSIIFYIIISLFNLISTIILLNDYHI